MVTSIGIDHIRGLTDLSLSNLRADKHSSPLTSGSIEIITGDGRLGYPPSAPYDVIHVGAAAPTMPQPLVEQLKRGGRMFIPVGEAGGAQSVWQVDKAVDGKMDMKELFGYVEGGSIMKTCIQAKVCLCPSPQ